MILTRKLVSLPLVALALLAVQAPAAAQCDPPGATVENGSGINPEGFQSASTPAVGEDWLSTVDAPGSLLSMVFVATQPAPAGIVIDTGILNGEILCLPPLVNGSISFTGGHSILIPNIPEFAGVSLTAQAIALSPGALQLQNALLLCVGA